MLRTLRMKNCDIDIQGEDIPFEQEESKIETALPSGYVDDLEHTVAIAGKLQRITLKTKAFTLIIWFTIALILLYALDVFITNLG